MDGIAAMRLHLMTINQGPLMQLSFMATGLLLALSLQLNVAGLASAQTQTAPAHTLQTQRLASPTALTGPAQPVVENFLMAQTSGLPGEISLQVSAPQGGPLPACADGALVAFLPAGSRAWGRVLVGVRCDSAAPWTRYVPAHVAVQGDYYVATRAVAAGQWLSPADAELRRGDLTHLPASVVTDLGQWQGAQALNPLAPGAPLRRESLRGQPLVQAGQTVKLLTRGPGFVISTEAKALTAASAGARLPLKLSNGQQVMGVLGADGQVERLQ